MNREIVENLHVNGLLWLYGHLAIDPKLTSVRTLDRNINFYERTGWVENIELLEQAVEGESTARTE